MVLSEFTEVKVTLKINCAPLVPILARSIRENPRNLPYYVCFWATPLPPSRCGRPLCMAPCRNNVSLIFGIFDPPSPCQNLRSRNLHSFHQKMATPLITDIICICLLRPMERLPGKIDVGKRRRTTNPYQPESI